MTIRPIARTILPPTTQRSGNSPCAEVDVAQAAKGVGQHPPAQGQRGQAAAMIIPVPGHMIQYSTWVLVGCRR
jgi:hypothetical protein